MLNKIEVIGKFLIKKEQLENKIDDSGSFSQEGTKEVDEISSRTREVEEDENGKQTWFRFSLMSWAPSGSKTTLRCVVQGEIAEKIRKEVIEGEVIKVQGYLRNEKIGRQIVIRVVNFEKVDVDFEKVDKSNSNRVRLLGKIITDLQPFESERNPAVLSFKLAVPREGVKSPLFFCRVNEKELTLEVREKLKKGDIVIIEGFLQTQKIEEETELDKKKFS